MNKTIKLAFIFSFLIISTVIAAQSPSVKGEVIDVDPIAGRLELKGLGEYFVTDASLLKSISRHDLIEAELTADKGDPRIAKLVKTGTAAPEEQGLPVGQAVQGLLGATGDTVKAVTSPIAPVHDTAGEGVHAVTEGTGEFVKDATGPSVTQDF